MVSRRILVTGAEGYVGTAILEHLARIGHRVCALDAPKAGQRGVDEAVYGPSGCDLPLIRADVVDLADMERAAAAASAALGGLDGLICNAGVMDADDGDVMAVTERAWDRTFEINVKGYWISVRAALPYLLNGRSPAIVIVSSLAAIRGSRTSQLAYTASKGAVSALARELAVSLAQFGVRVNSICPGPLDGGLLAPRLTSKLETQGRIAAIPLRRLGEARDVASACSFLISEESDYISGTELVVDGGAAAAF